jgi:glucose-6-phosphate-specific signal transduction histidine kinase
MRRVYYSYGISIVSHSMFWQGLFLSVATLLLARWLHVASIINNFLSVPVGSVPNYMYGSFKGAFTHGEALTAITLVVAGILAVSVGYKITHSVMSKMVWYSRV